MIENSSKVQAVRETNLNMLGVNSYAQDGSTVEGITVDKPASYMVKEDDSYERAIFGQMRDQNARISWYCGRGVGSAMLMMIEDEMSEWLLSDRAFVGGLDTKDKNGVFAMQLHGSEKYGLESFEATKTYHFCEDMIVCLGSGISCGIEAYPSETTLFQDFGTGAVRNGNVLTDNRGNGYIVFDGGENIVFGTEECTSRGVKDHEDTVGTRTFGIINHGNAPQDAHYGYLLKVGGACGEKEINVIGESISAIRQDAAAHIVRIFDKTNYVFFRKNYDMMKKSSAL